MATTGMVGQTVPLNQPRPSALNCRFRGTGAGGRCPPFTMSEMGHQIRNATTITVVICMMRSALLLDS